MTADETEIVNGDTGVYSLACEMTVTSSVGAYNIVGTALDDNYDITFANETDAYVVTAKPLTVTINNASSVYGSAQVELTATADGIVNGDTNVYSLACEVVPTTVVGTYNIIGTPLDANYDITFVNWEKSYAVTKKALTVTAKGYEVTYGDAAPQYEVNYSGFVNGENENALGGTLAYTCAYAAMVGVGTYDIVPAGYTSDNYEITFETGTLTVVKKALTVTAVDKAVYYGDDVPDYTVDYVGFAGTEDHTKLGGALAFDCGYAKTSPVSDYTITPGGYTSGNYDITFVSGTVTVSPRPITITIAEKTSVYGSEQVALTADETEIVNGDTGVYSLSCVVEPTTAVGTYDITGKTLNNNYKITFENWEKSYAVTKKGLTVTAKDYAVTYGDAAPDYTVSFDGFVNDENENALGGVLAYTCIYPTEYAVNTYAITPYGYTSDNYEFTFESGTLTVNRKQLTVTACGEEVEYGDPVPAYKVTYNGFVEGEDEQVLTGTLGFDCEYSPTKGIGEYVITPRGYEEVNYTYNYESAKIKVRPREITIAVINASSVYGSAQADLTANETEIVNGDTGVYSLSCVVSATTPVGTYNIVGTALDDNYDITFANETDAYVVTAKPLTVTINNASSVYGSAQVELTATADGIVNGDTNVYSLACEVVPTTVVGTYNIIGTPLDANYDITFVNWEKSYAVTKKALTVTAKDYEVTYGDAAPQYEVICSGFVNDENENALGGVLAYTCIYPTEYAVKSYAITPYGYTSDNYEITFKSGTLTVKKKALTVTAIDKDVIYGEAAPDFEVSYNGFVQGEDESVLGGALSFVCDYAIMAVVGTTHDIIVSGYTSDNYDITYETGTLTVIARPLTVTADDMTVTYGDAAPAYTATITGFAGEEDVTVLSGTLTFACTYSEMSPVGEYTIKPYGYTADNYDITFKPGKLTVAPLALTVLWSNCELTYNGDYQVPTATATALADDDLGLHFTDDSYKKHVGVYTAKVETNNPNYSLQDNERSFKIEQYVLSVSWSNYEVMYNAEEQWPEYSVELFEGDSIDIALSAKRYEDNSDVQPRNADTYVIYASIVSVDPDYKLSDTTSNHQFVINEKELIIDWTNTTLTYNACSQMPTAIVSQIQGDDPLGLSVSNSTGDPSVYVGVYTARAEIANTNYVLTNDTQEYEIEPFELDLKWYYEDSSAEQEEPYVYNTLRQDINVDIISQNLPQNKDGIRDTLDIALSYYNSTPVHAGVYTATAGVSGEAGSNYIIKEDKREFAFEIRPYAVDIVWQTADFVYDGSVQSVWAYYYNLENPGSEQWLTVGIIEGGNEFKNAGDYTMEVTINNTDYIPRANAYIQILDGENELVYNYSTSKDYTMAPKPINVTIENKQSVYGSVQVSLTAVDDGIVNDDTDVYSLSCTVTATSPVGTYDIVGTALDGNYDITFANETDAYVVIAKQLTVTINNATSVYGSAQAELTADETEIVNGDANVYSLSCEVAPTTAVGTYDIVGTALDANYDITFVNGENAYEVTKKGLTVTADDKAVTYGDAAPGYTVFCEGFAGDDNVTVLGGMLQFTCSYAAMDVVDTYTITPYGYTSDNYDITFLAGTLTVGKKQLTVAANGDTITEGDPAPVYSYTTSGWAGADDTNTYLVDAVAAAVIISCDYAISDPAGEYDIELSFDGAFTADNVLDNYQVVLVNAMLVVAEA